MSGRWYACRTTFDFEIDLGEDGFSYRQEEACEAVYAETPMEAEDMMVLRHMPYGYGWSVLSNSARECADDDEAAERVARWRGSHG